MHYCRRGFTMLELMIALGIFLTLAAVTIPLTRGLYTSAQLDDVRDTLVQQTRTAQVRARSGVNGSSHGIYVEQNQYTLFQGETYAGRDVTQDRVIETNSVDLSFSAAGSVIIFARGTGLPNATGTMQLVHSEQGTSTISINTVGLVDISS